MDDYKYFPDPDIQSYSVPVSAFCDKRSRLWKLDAKTGAYAARPRVGPGKRLLQYPSEQFLAAVTAADEAPATVKTLGNYFTSDVTGLLEEGSLQQDASPTTFAALAGMVSAGITSRVAKDLLAEVVFEQQDPKLLAEERGLLQQSSEADLLPALILLLLSTRQSLLSTKRAKKPRYSF